ncbi:hypothetical protein [Candidatus Nitrosotenuis cloacae]|uniref:Uncharacterized protein n=1 Tax=Candidatus Nitrosotenuis cloacae TaxID=1603555 RepID=A0A3G1AZM1_9ARCH|nr:hypothetical protein [Candidatus Nitrosotenuis cloacae]AJZ75348.1 hypothetical protein SU86_001960 [Candidatus Nitrosotenuis cloacae]
MTKIQTLDEFKKIKNVEFGLIVVCNKTNTLHQSNCQTLKDEDFTKSEYYWFATISLAEKSFDVMVCDSCKPEQSIVFVATTVF